MFLTNQQKERILAWLNEPERVEAFITFNQGHPDRAQWISDENHNYDTSYSPFRRAHVEWFDEQLSELAQKQELAPQGKAQEEKIHSLVKTTDFYFYSGESDEKPQYPKEWLDLVELPFAAVKVLDTVFTFSFDQQAWLQRPWLGIKDDPLMRMPYSRKYDFERVELAEIVEKRNWERIRRAIDFIEMIAKRVDDVDLQLTDNEFKIPDYSDIAEEMAKDDSLGIGLCDILGMGGQINFDLWELEHGFDKEWYERHQKPGPPICSGCYRGVLGGSYRHRPGGASLKKMVAEALDQLVLAAWTVTYTPHSEAYVEEFEQLEAAKDEVYRALNLRRSEQPANA